MLPSYLLPSLPPTPSQQEQNTFSQVCMAPFCDFQGADFAIKKEKV